MHDEISHVTLFDLRIPASLLSKSSGWQRCDTFKKFPVSKNRFSRTVEYRNLLEMWARCSGYFTRFRELS